MAVLDEAFIGAMGRPDPATPNGLRLADWQQGLWDGIYRDIGAGWFRDGFLYLFGEGLEALAPCVEAWSFLVPPNDDRVILGRNAYGAILVLENASNPRGQRVKLLDPWTVTYHGSENLNFTSLIGRALPKRELVDFLDDRAYHDWRKRNRVSRLRLHDVLGIKVPKGLGGKLVADNLQLDGIVDYYKTTAPIYADAFAKSKA